MAAFGRSVPPARALAACCAPAAAAAASRPWPGGGKDSAPDCKPHPALAGRKTSLWSGVGAPRATGACVAPVSCQGAPADGGFAATRTPSRFHRSDLIDHTSVKPFADTYTREKLLGQGAYGAVYRAVNKDTGVIRAVKEIKKKDLLDVKAFRAEAGFLMELDHPNVIRLVEFIEDEKLMYLVFELCTGPDLVGWIESAKKSELGRLTEAEVSVALRQMLLSLLACHFHGIVHRDVKPDNFMLKDVQRQDHSLTIKLIDLGLSEHFQNNADDSEAVTSGTFGTLSYMAPEVLKGSCGRPADVWSLGVSFYVMLTGERLFSRTLSEKKLRRAISDEAHLRAQLDKITPASHPWISASALDLLKSMLRHDSHDRITAAAALEHPFVLSSYQHTLEQEKGRGLDVNVVEKIMKFSRMPTLRRVAFMMMAHGLDDSKTRVQRRTFRHIDKNGDGELSEDEIVEFARDHLGDGIPQGFHEVFGAVADVDETNSMSYTEFLAATAVQHSEMKPAFLQSFFRLLDVDDDKKISIEDLNKFFHFRMGTAELIQIIGEADRGNKGYLDNDDLFALMADSYD